MSFASRAVLWMKWNRLGMSLRRRGLVATASHIRDRISEHRFDALHRVETACKIPATSLGVSRDAFANEYTPVTVSALARVLSRLPIDSDWDFVDLGAGKGRALLIASLFPFRKIVGVELSPDLVHIAEENIRIFRDRRQQCFDLSVVLADAQTYQFSGTKAVLYMFDPFLHPVVMRNVLHNVTSWLQVGQRSLNVIYWNSRYEGVFDEFPGLRLTQKTPMYCLYKGGSDYDSEN